MFGDLGIALILYIVAIIFSLKLEKELNDNGGTKGTN